MSIERAVEYRGTTLRIGDIERPYFEAAGDGQLLLQSCRSCTTARYPPSPRCRACGSTQSVWTKVTGVGRVYACVVVEHSVRESFHAPYAIGLIELEETASYPLEDSVRILSTILEGDGETPMTDIVPDGTAVEVCFRSLGGGYAFPEFRTIGI